MLRHGAHPPRCCVSKGPHLDAQLNSDRPLLCHQGFASRLCPPALGPHYGVSTLALGGVLMGRARQC